MHVYNHSHIALLEFHDVEITGKQISLTCMKQIITRVTIDGWVITPRDVAYGVDEK